MEGIARLKEYVVAAKRILIFTGAGISTTSGIPDYRGPSGVWKTKQPVYYHDFMQSEAARLTYWQDKMEAWQTFKQAKPTAVHKAIVDLEKAGRIDLVVTQNVDGLHRLAGTSVQKLVELHGTNSKVECQTCHAFSDPELHFDFVQKTGRAPTCEHCGGFLKPATISFGQALREHDLKRSVQAAQRCDLVIALGSTLSVYPAASITLLAAEQGAPYIVINRGVTEHDTHKRLSLRIEGDVEQIFPPAVAEALKKT